MFLCRRGEGETNTFLEAGRVAHGLISSLAHGEGEGHEERKCGAFFGEERKARQGGEETGSPHCGKSKS